MEHMKEEIEKSESLPFILTIAGYVKTAVEKALKEADESTEG